MKTRCASALLVAIITVVTLIIGNIAWAQIRAHITRSVDRTQSTYHQHAYRAMGKSLLLSMGGVLAQTQTLRTKNVAKAVFALKLSLTKGDYSGSLDLVRNDSHFKFPVAYDDLVPISLFIDSGGTSLYTFWEEDLPKDFPRDAGFAQHPDRGYIALEFKYTKFSDVLLYVDLCRLCLGNERPDLTDKINAAFAGGTPDELAQERTGEGQETYINADVETDYRLDTSNAKASVTGEIIRYHWDGLKNREETVITNADAFLVPEAFSATLDKIVEDQRKEIESLIETIKVDLEKLRHERSTTNDKDKGAVLDEEIEFLEWKLQETEEAVVSVDKMKKTDLALHRDAFRLYETLALLRSFKAHASKDAWERFMESVRALADMRPEPWIAYTKAYCEVYGDSAECAAEQ